MSTENPTLDMDLDDPFIARYATKVADPTEVLLRADFARAQAQRHTAWQAETDDERHLRLNEVRGIEQRWQGREDEFGETWWYLNDAHHDWLSAPDTMRRFHDQIHLDQAAGVHGLTDVQWRSQQQARELTGHGSWSAPEPEAARDPIPGHAFAGLVNNHYREQEMER